MPSRLHVHILQAGINKLKVHSRMFVGTVCRQVDCMMHVGGCKLKVHVCRQVNGK